MSTVVFEHVPLLDLPAAWRARFPAPSSARVTVRIEEETEPTLAVPTETNALFGMWADRVEVADVQEFARKLRTPRTLREG
ncbi:MAG: hypothetical protein EXR77_18230 [Myxococcales bacterium]|nr:hypothetical protein [Myxococcales bacterium]